MTNGFEDIQKAGLETLNRTMESLGAVSRGMQTVAVETTEFSKKSFEDGAAHVEALLSAKSVEKAAAMQADFVKSSYETMLGQANRFGELYMGLAKEMTKPFEGILPTPAK